jgi:glycine hydroxymethyltransferase
VISTTTHKTLRGPRGAILMCGEERASDIDRAVFPGLQGGPHNHVLTEEEARSRAQRDLARTTLVKTRSCADG